MNSSALSRNRGVKITLVKKMGERFPQFSGIGFGWGGWKDQPSVGGQGERRICDPVRRQRRARW